MLTKWARRLRRLAGELDWPPNLWMGVSVENAQVLDRVDDLRGVPAAVRFLSCEPLLGPLDDLDLAGIGWVIAGGESGAQARPIDPGWVRALRDRCIDCGVPFFFKQWGGRTPRPVDANWTDRPGTTCRAWVTTSHAVWDDSYLAEKMAGVISSSMPRWVIRAFVFTLLLVSGVVLVTGPFWGRMWSWLNRPRSADWWGAAGQWAGAVGTIAAVVVALWIAIRDGKHARHERHQAALRERREQASKVTAWIEYPKRETFYDGGRPVDLYMIVSNASTDAINHVVVSFDIFKSLPTREPYIHRGEDVGEDEFMYAILPPGRWRMPVGPGWAGMSAQPGVTVAFTDSNGNHWVRVTDGTLIEKEEGVIERRQIYFPQRISVPAKY